MSAFRSIWHLAVALTLAAAPTLAAAQATVDARLPSPTARFGLDGPRFGVTLLSSGIQAKLADRGIDAGGMITQFGWQFERQFLGTGENVVPITEVVVLVGGLDQSLFLPSLSWVVGLRSRRGTEFGVGPNITAAGVALAVGAGVTLRQKTLNIPINVAVVPSASGLRVSVLTGFSMR